MIYRLKNWQRFQHYKDRNPPWIKLHYELLSSRDWVAMDDASRVLAVACMLIASRNDGQIDGSEDGLEYLQRVAYLRSPPNLKPLIASGFLEPASKRYKTLASASTSVSVSSDIDLSKNQDEEVPRGTKPDPLGPSELKLHESLPLDSWGEWMEFRRLRRWPVDLFTLRKQLKVLAKLTNEQQRAAIDNSIQSNWQGVFAPKGNAASANRPTRYEQLMTTLDKWNPNDTRTDEAPLAITGPDVGQPVS